MSSQAAGKVQHVLGLSTGIRIATKFQLLSTDQTVNAD